jgi:hypothetical protein
VWTDSLPPLADELARSRHPRLTTLEFLQICTPRIRRFWDYWNSKRGTRPMPSRADLDPLEMGPLLPYIVLTEVMQQPPWLIYRLVGTKQVAVRGHDPTGQPVMEHYIGHHLGNTASEVLLNYRLVIERCAIVFDYNHIEGPDGGGGSFDQMPVQETGTLLLPLSNDGHKVNMIFCCSDIAET